MNKRIFYLFVFIISLISLHAQNEIPVLSNIHYQYSNFKIDLEFDLSDNENDQLEIQCKLFNMDEANKFTEIFPDFIQGDIGFPILQGNGKKISIQLNPSTIASRVHIVLKTSDQQLLQADDLIRKVDSNRLKSIVQQLQGIRNKNNQNFYDNSRTYLFDQLNSKVPARRIEQILPLYTCVNIESTKLGFEHPAQIHAIDAHYDSYNQAPGADDNASGVAGVLEAYHILSSYSSKYSLRFLNFDLEEAGLVGSLLYANNQISKRDSLKSVVNLEMIGYYSNEPNSQTLPTGFNVLFPDAYNAVVANERRGDFITNVGNTGSVQLKNSFHNSVTKFIPELKIISLEVPGTGTLTPDLRRSDHATFWDLGVPALMITDGANFRNKNYHTVRDSINSLNFLFMTNVVKACIATLIENACIEHASHTEIPINLSTNAENKSNDVFTVTEGHASLFISLANPVANFMVHLTNLEGHSCFTKVFTHSNSTEFQIPTRELSPGIYILTITSDNRIQSKKVSIHD